MVADHFVFYTRAHLLALTTVRSGEVKLGECLETVSSLDELPKAKCRFVLIGIPEDIGVRANFGTAGAATAWKPTIKALLNIQSNSFFDGGELLLLGHFEIASPEEDASVHSLQNKVEEMDRLIKPLIQAIVSCGKIPIVIGGGHNNAYPIIMGVTAAIAAPISVINIDAHADLRPASGRHSGNGFSYAIRDGLITNYRIFGLHQNYNNKAILEELKSDTTSAIFFDDMLKSDEPILSFWSAMLSSLPSDAVTGLEIDLDSVENTLSSAMTSSGFSINELRRMMLHKENNPFAYLHICEGAASTPDGRNDPILGKTISYLITDFIKSRRLKIDRLPTG